MKVIFYMDYNNKSLSKKEIFDLNKESKLCYSKKEWQNFSNEQKHAIVEKWAYNYNNEYKINQDTNYSIRYEEIF